MTHTMKKTIFIAAVILVVAGVGITLFYQPNVERIQFSATLFSGAEQYENFNRVKEIYPTTKLTAATTPYRFPEGEPMALPDTYTFNGEKLPTEDFLATTDTSALLILEDGRLRFENYYLTGGETVPWISMSVAKSYIATLLGMAVEEGKIDSIEDPITRYVPELAGSAYDGVRIKDVMQMSSGAAWNEDYADPQSDVMRMAGIMAVGGSLDKFTATVKSERTPGEFNQYNSADTQALGMLLTRAVGESITDYMQRKLWQPLGAESDAYWMVDDNNMEMAFGGLNATARDYARLGELYPNRGAWQGEQLVSAAWVDAAVTPDAPHLQPGENTQSDYVLGYGYQWWIMDGDEGEYAAIGVYNQFIYVNPSRDLVIVKLSANSDYASTPDESGYRELETIAFFRTIGQSLATETAVAQ